MTDEEDKANRQEELDLRLDDLTRERNRYLELMERARDDGDSDEMDKLRDLLDENDIAYDHAFGILDRLDDEA